MEQFTSLRQEYLDRIIRHDMCPDFRPTELGIACSRGDTGDEALRCSDCLVSGIMCVRCILEVHKDGNIYHRIEVNTIGDQFDYL